MKKIVIFGTSGNPIHIGHELIIKEISKHFDEVWVCPSYKSSIKNLIDPKHRLKMTEILVNSLNNDKVKIFDYEIKNKISVNTYDFLKYLKSNFSDKQFYFGIGADNTKDILNWKNSNDLINENNFLIFKRKGYDLNVNIFKSYETIDVEFIDVSSTYIRNNIRNENVKSLLNSEVYNYIVENNLYF